MGLFKSKYERDLDAIIFKLNMNLSNNYKDNAQSDFKDLEELFRAYVEEGKLKEKAKAYYENEIDNYRIRLKGNTHKEQKPYWT